MILNLGTLIDNMRALTGGGTRRVGLSFPVPKLSGHLQGLLIEYSVFGH